MELISQYIDLYFMHIHTFPAICCRSYNFINVCVVCVYVWLAEGRRSESRQHRDARRLHAVTAEIKRRQWLAKTGVLRCLSSSYTCALCKKCLERFIYKKINEQNIIIDLNELKNI